MNTIKYLFQTLYKNQTVIDGRKKPWYISFVFFILGFFMMWVPILSKGYTTYCASALFNTSSSTNSQLDKAMLEVFDSNYFKTITFKKNTKTGQMNLNLSLDLLASDSISTLSEGIKTQNDIEYKGTNDKELLASKFSFTEDGCDYSFNYYYDVISEPISTHYSKPTNTSSVTYEDPSNTNNRVILLQAYYLDLNDDYSENIALTEFIKKNILNLDSTEKQMNNFPHSFIIFSTNRIYLNIYSLRSAKTNNPLTAYQGYISEAVTDDLENKTLYSLITDNLPATANLKEKNDATYQSFADFLHSLAFKNNINTVWFNIGIISTIYVGTILLSSGILIFMHKRKGSTSKDTNYFEALKEAMTLSFTPSIIGLAMGFYNFSFEITLFVMAVLFRVFFMYSKIVPPSYGASNKPLYQARQ